MQRADEQLYLAKNEGRNCVKFSADGAGLRVQRHAGSFCWGLWGVVWNEEYSSGNAEIDGQHQELVSIVNGLLEHVIAEEDAPDMHSRFKNIYHLVEKHFADEEEILLSSKYPEAEAHAVCHNELLQKCAGLLRQDAENPVSSQMLQCNMPLI